MRFSSLVMVPVLLGSAVALAQPGSEPQPDPNAPPAPAPAPAPMPAPAPAPVMQPPPPEATVVGGDPLKSGGFITGDRFDMNNRVGAELSYAVLDNDDASGTLMGFDIHGSFIDPASHLGGYASLPLGAIFGSDDDDDNAFAIGNAQLGGLYAAPISPTAGIIARVGVVLPTAADDDQAKGVAITYSGFRRLTDVLLAVPAGKGLRLSASPMFRNGNIFGRADVGLDMVWFDPGSGDDNIRYTAFRLNGGLGVDLQSIQLMGELNLVRLSIDVDGYKAETNTNLAVTARVPTGQIEPYFGLVLPLDDDINDVITVFLTAGLEARI